MKKYKKIEGKDLIKGNTYCDVDGSYKCIYEGMIKGILGEDRCLFTPIGNTCYILYNGKDYGGKYNGKFSLHMTGHFYEEQVINKGVEDTVRVLNTSWIHRFKQWFSR